MPNSNVHYVKFMRGSISAWESLNLTPERIDDDTLYFIYESDANKKEGKLYLGQKLISGVGENGSGTGNININDIGDVDIGSEIPLSDYQILVYNETNNKWENTSLSTIINEKITEISVFVGATQGINGSSDTAGKAGLVPAPPAGAHDKFLKGDGTWAFTPVPSFHASIFTVTDNLVTLNGFNAANVHTIPIKTNNGLEWTNLPAGRLDREIVTLQELQARLDGTSQVAISTDTIYMVDNGNDSSTNNKYDEYMIINNRLERLGTFGQVDLTNYVQVITFNQAIGSIHRTLYDQIDDVTGTTIPGLVSRVSTIETNFSKIGNLNNLSVSPGNSTLVEEVNTIGDRLKWHELNNS